MKFTCPKCRAEKEETEFPPCWELREAIANGQIVPKVACDDCQQIMKNPSSPEFEKLVHQAWERGENVV